MNPLGAGAASLMGIQPMLGFFSSNPGLTYFLLLFLSDPIQWSPLLCGLHSLLPPVHLLSPSWLSSHLPHKTWVPLPPP